jgi:hypothetical protein
MQNIDVLLTTGRWIHDDNQRTNEIVAKYPSQSVRTDITKLQ